MALIVAAVLWFGAHMGDEYAGVVSLPFDREVPWLGGSDFPAFYGGAKLLLSEPTHAYDPDSQLNAILKAKGYDPDHVEEGSPWYRYYNPPAYSLLLAPLTLLDLQTAYSITLVLNLAGLALLLRSLSSILAERRRLYYLCAGVVITSVPVNYAFWHAQPTLFLAAFFGLTLSAAESGLAKRAGAYWALLFAKPHWMALPALFTPRRNPRSLVSFAIVAVVVALPFAIIGLEGIHDYVAMILNRGASDIADDSFAEAVLSWSGFFRGLSGSPQPLDMALMSALTLLFAALVYLRSWRSDFAPAAITCALLLVVPHSHPQDWIMLAPAGAFLIRRQNGLSLAISTSLLIGIYAGLYDWSSSEHAGLTYWSTLGAFGLLVWTYVLSELPARDGEANRSVVATQRDAS